MTISELIFVKKLFNEYPIAHTVKLQGNLPVNIYSILAVYKTEQRVINKSVLTIKSTPKLNLFEIIIGDKCVYAKEYSTIKEINISKATRPETEDHIILEILNICKEKVAKTYANQLKEIQTFLQQIDDIKSR